MDTFCLLEIQSRSAPKLPDGIFLRRAMNEMEFVDNQSPARQEQRRRLAAKGALINPRVARYWWTLSSQGFVADSDLSAHLIWLMKCVKPGVVLTELAKSGFRCALSASWSGNGTGGGPTITPEAAEMMALHSLPLTVSFYALEEG